MHHKLRRILGRSHLGHVLRSSERREEDSDVRRRGVDHRPVGVAVLFAESDHGRSSGVLFDIYLCVYLD